MANTVIKRDGSEEPFDPQKIKDSIAAACDGANLREQRKNELVEEVSQVAVKAAAEKDKIPSSEIRGKILTELDRVEPSVSEAWREYDRKRGRV